MGNFYNPITILLILNFKTIVLNMVKAIKMLKNILKGKIFLKKHWVKFKRYIKIKTL